LNGVNWTPWLTLGVLVLVVALLAVTLRLIQQRTNLSGEAVRKLSHLCGGAVALSLPWLFDSLWPILALGVGSAGVLVLLRSVSAFRTGPGQLLHAASRHSMGEFWFLLGAFMALIIARPSVVLYSIGIVALALADTAAALVGGGYGRRIFEVPGGTKTVEGSAALFLTALLCVLLPLLLFTDAGRWESLLLAFNVSVLLMLAEADSPRGSDNFVIPVLVVVLLELFLQMNRAELALHSGVIVALGAYVLAYRNRTTLSADALIAAVLVGYLFWVFGGWRWLLPPFILFSTYTWAVGRPRLASSRPFHADVALAIMAPGVVLATTRAVLGLEWLYWPFVAVWSANMAVIGMLHSWLEDPGAPAQRLAVVNGAKSLVVLVPGIAAGGAFHAWASAGALVSVGAALALFVLTGSTLRREPTRPGAWGRLTLSVGCGTLVGFVPVALIGWS
jgi:phytol kinase